MIRIKYKADNGINKSNKNLKFHNNNKYNQEDKDKIMERKKKVKLKE